MNANKIKTALLGLIILAGGFFNAFSNNASRYVIKTKYFDVIFHGPSKQTAQFLAENIDDIYLDIRKSYKVEDYYTFKHFPVYVEFSTQELNAYYTDYPFRQIVFYDTLPTSDMAVFNETVSGIIKHELTHAVAMNVKNKGNEVFSNIIYNGWGWQFYTTPTSVSEGFTVSLESENGEGRLNSPFATHIIKQAKIENKFPKHQQATGARDIYPTGNVPYLFGGAFTQFVKDKYGTDKFPHFLLDLTTNLLNYYVIYKNNFGTDLEADWKEFQDSIDVSDIDANPYSVDGVLPFLTKSQKKLSRTNIVASYSIPFLEGGVVYYDSASSEVWFRKYLHSKENDKVLYEEKIYPESEIFIKHPKKLFTMTGVTKLSLSCDGRYLAVSRVNQYSVFKTNVYIYDMKKKCFVNKTHFGFREGTVLFDGENYFFTAVKTVSQNSSLEIYSLKDNRLENIKSIPLDFGDVALNLSDAGNGRIAFLLKQKDKWSISLYYKDLDKFTLFEIPPEIQVRDLSVLGIKHFITGKDAVIMPFSYGTKNTLPRLGYLGVNFSENEIKSASFHLLNKDLSGGIYSPVISPDSHSASYPDVVFSSHFFDNSKLSVLTADSFGADDFEILFTQYQTVEKIADNKTDNELNQITSSNNRAASNSTEEIKKFNPFEYTFRGIFVPLGVVPFFDNEFNPTGIGIAGLTWSSKRYLITAGYEPLKMCYGVGAAVFDWTPTQNMLYVLFGTCGFDENGFRQTEDELYLQAQIPVFKHSNIVFSSTSKFFYGEPNYMQFTPENIFRTQDPGNFSTTFSTTTAVKFSTLRKSDVPYHSKLGFYIGPSFNYSYINWKKADNSNVFITKGNGMNLGLNFGFDIPNILPFENPEDMTCNLPLTFDANIFPDISKAADFSCKLVLFSKEVQQGTSHFFLPLYMNRFYISASYSGGLYYKDKITMAILDLPKTMSALENSTYADTVGLGINIAFTINTGDLVKLGVLDLGAELLFDINQKAANQNRFHLKLCNKLVF